METLRSGFAQAVVADIHPTKLFLQPRLTAAFLRAQNDRASGNGSSGHRCTCRQDIPRVRRALMPEATMLQGDCLEILPTLPKGSVDMVFADLPYGVTQNGWDQLLDMQKLWPMLTRLSRRGGPYLFTCQQPFTTAIVNSAPNLLRYDLVWKKNRYAGYAAAEKAPLRGHETILVFGATPVYKPQKIDTGQLAQLIFAGKHPKPNKNTGQTSKTHILSRYRYPTSVLAFDRDDVRDGTGHPTQKPLNMLSWLIRTYTLPGATVLDPTSGSGSTALAAVLCGRNAIAIEKDPTIFANAKERVMAVQRSLRPKVTAGG